MKEVKRNNNILYRIEKDFPVVGVNFVDLTPTITTMNHFKEVAMLLVDKIKENNEDIDYIISPDARGFLWGTYVASILNKPLIPVRKHGKLPSSCVMATSSDKTEYSSIELDLPEVDLIDKKCIFIDDVYATGGTFKACQRLVSNCGGKLESAYVILNVLLTEDNVNCLMTSDELQIDNDNSVDN